MQENKSIISYIQEIIQFSNQNGLCIDSIYLLKKDYIDFKQYFIDFNKKLFNSDKMYIINYNTFSINRYKGIKINEINHNYVDYSYVITKQNSEKKLFKLLTKEKV